MHAPDVAALRKSGGLAFTDESETVARSPRLAWRLLCGLVPLLVLLAIWVPELAHFYVPGTAITPELVQKSRSAPSDDVLLELERMQFGAPGHSSKQERIAAGEGLLAGELRLPGQAAFSVTLPFSPTDLEKPAGALAFASLVSVQILLDAFESSGQERFFLAASRVVQAFARYERTAWLDHGLMWNDHAIAARIAVLIKFWRMYRGRADFEPAAAESVLQLLARSAQLLSKPSHYTFRTNHGVMQNLALLQLCAAFPHFSDAPEWCSTGRERLEKQLRYYVNSEGVVLEHSAGYHGFGMELIGMAMRCFALLQWKIPAEWFEKYERAQSFYSLLRRPDGTLPTYGDTSFARHVPIAAVLARSGEFPALRPVGEWRPQSAFGIYPVAGHAVWWRNLEKWPAIDQLSQTVLTWSYFPGHGHKLADEMSIVLWGAGHTWVTNPGYWPYTAGREQAEGWEPTNAPHLAGEPKNSQRNTELLGYVDDAALSMVDVRRAGPDGYAARRQLLQLGSKFWLVLDHVRDTAARKSVTTWTVGPAIRVRSQSGSDVHRLVSQDGRAVSAVFLASPGARTTVVRGSLQPFAGWVVTESGPQAASAFRIEQPSLNSWAAALWIQDGPAKPALEAQPALEWSGAESWTISVPLTEGKVILQRAGNELRVQQRAEISRSSLVAVRQPATELADLRQAFEREKAASVKYRELYPYRLKVTLALLALLALQELALFAVRKTIRKHVLPIRTALAMCWLVLGAWTVFVYLK